MNAYHRCWPYPGEPCVVCEAQRANTPLTRGERIQIVLGAAAAFVAIGVFLILLFTFGPVPA